VAIDDMTAEQDNTMTQKIAAQLMNTGFPFLLGNGGKIDPKVDIKFLKQDVVSNKRQAALMMKAKFLAKINHLGLKGKYFTVMHKVWDWLHENIDSIFDKFQAYQLKKLSKSQKKAKLNLSRKLQNSEYAKRKLIIDLMGDVEILMKNRWNHLRQKKVGAMKDKTALNVDYESRQAFICN
jgi:hypothetical protein